MAATPDARTRILETADRLFYQDGIRAVGIDRIIAEAGVAKMTLYAHFPSKDDLIVATLCQREQAMVEYIRCGMAKHGKRKADPVRAFFAALKDLFASPGFRGCPFQNAAAELADPAHPGGVYAREQKKRFAKTLQSILESSVGDVDDKTVAAVAMLVEGAILTAMFQGTATSADVARDATLKLLGQG